MTTITISVNISTGNKYEGNSNYSLDIPEYHLMNLNPESFNAEVAKIILEARDEYCKRND
jgi:hypothetical protein